MKVSIVHWLALGMFLTGMATQVSSLPSWHDATSPVFISGVIMNLGSIIVAAASGKLFPTGVVDESKTHTHTDTTITTSN
jgi:hypothetical protein